MGNIARSRNLSDFSSLLSELANLPMVTPGVLLGFGKRKGASRHTFLANRGL